MLAFLVALNSRSGQRSHSAHVGPKSFTITVGLKGKGREHPQTITPPIIRDGVPLPG